jgi:hypothetical protein
MSKSLESRLWAKIDQRGADECWPWLGFVYRGSPLIKVNGRNSSARRQLWKLTRGPLLSPSLIIVPRCKTRRCMNLSHCVLTTRSKAALLGSHPWSRAALTEVCPQGHEYAGNNVHRQQGGARECRTCRRESTLRWNLAHPEERKRVVRRCRDGLLADPVRYGAHIARRRATTAKRREDPAYRDQLNAKGRAWHGRLREAGLCGQCGGPREDKWALCPACRERSRAVSAQIKRDRREAGLCVQCGQPSDFRYYCDPCAASRNAYTRARKRAKRLAA